MKDRWWMLVSVALPLTVSGGCSGDPESSVAARKVSYENDSSGLVSTTVQGAIDDLAAVSTDHESRVVALETSSGQGWIDGANDSIHYVDGSVGIGTNDPKSTLHVEGYVQLRAISGSTPFVGDCDEASEFGRVVVYWAANLAGDNDVGLWVCTRLDAAGIGWVLIK